MADCTSQIIIVDGYAGYVYTIATATLTTITDANFPGVSTGTAPTSVAFLNGSFYVPVPGSRTFIKSQPLDGLTWTPYVFGTKENSSDSVVGIDVINGTLVVYGSQTMEFWQDAGLSPLPVQRINGATQNWGVAAVFSWAHAGSTAMFLGVNPDGNNRIVVLNGYTPVPVSDPDIDAILDSSYLLGGSTALVYSVLGHSMYQMTVQGRTLVYDLTTKMWHEAQTGTVDNARHIGNLSVAFNNNNYISDYAAPKIYLLNPSVYTDNGTTIVRQVCTRHIRSDGNELFLGQLALEFETGVANSDSTNPTVNIYVSRDGGHTFGPAKPKPLGAAGAYIRRARWKRLGSGIDIVIKIVVTDPVKFVLASGQASVDVVDD
jgi:hypothetical protein